MLVFCINLGFVIIFKNSKHYIRWKLLHFKDPCDILVQRYRLGGESGYEHLNSIIISIIVGINESIFKMLHR